MRTTGSRGFAMTELMVALALSSVVVLSIVSLFSTNSQTMRVQNAVGEANEAGRYALVRMSRDLRMLGFRAGGYRVPTRMDDALIATTGVSDTLTLRFEAPVDCNRQPAGPGGVVTNVYRVNNDTLLCNEQPLARGVEEMRILLGEDLDGDQVPNRYVLADAPGLDIERVVSVRIDLLVRSREDHVTNDAPVFHHEWNKNTDRDRHLRHEFSVTVALRNRLL